MPEYLSPGVYVEEKPSAMQSIASGGTSTPGFIGIFGDQLKIPIKSNLYDPAKPYTLPADYTSPDLQAFDDEEAAAKENLDSVKENYDPKLKDARKAVNDQKQALKDAETDEDKQAAQQALDDATTTLNNLKKEADKAIAEAEAQLEQAYRVTDDKVKARKSELSAEIASAKKNLINLQKQLKQAKPEDKEGIQTQITEAQTALDKAEIEFSTLNLPYEIRYFDVVAAPGEVIFCANFGDFAKYFGSFSLDEGQNRLAQAVYGFFQNGGARCFVTRVASENDFSLALERFEAVDDIAIVAAPGVANRNIWGKLKAHCAEMNDRFAVLDTAEAPAETDLGDIDVAELTVENEAEVLPTYDKNAAVYFPWLQIVDPALKTVDPENTLQIGNGTKAHAGRVYVPPSGHVAGVYARTDVERGVHKAPANTDVRGIVGLRYNISKAQQDMFNPNGLNCIRFMNGAYKVWGARTIGGDTNGEWRYVNVRRTFISIMEDIDKGTQWAVFEPNDQDLWAKITMNVSAYLEGRRRAGALFGTSPEQAYFVKCDAETNPPAERELGRVRTLIGVAIVRPAEFVIFEISQMTPQA